MRLFNRTGWLLFLPAVILICSTSAFAAQSITARLPLVFEPNRGQAPAQVQYLLRGGALEGEFQKDGVLFRLSDAAGGCARRVGQSTQPVSRIVAHQIVDNSCDSCIVYDY